MYSVANNYCHKITSIPKFIFQGLLSVIKSREVSKIVEAKPLGKSKFG